VQPNISVDHCIYYAAHFIIIGACLLNNILESGGTQEQIKITHTKDTLAVTFAATALQRGRVGFQFSTKLKKKIIVLQRPQVAPCSGQDTMDSPSPK